MFHRRWKYLQRDASDFFQKMCSLDVGTLTQNLFHHSFKGGILYSAVNLPSLVHNFDHAHIEQVIVGPRHEVTFIVTPLLWDGHNGVYATPVSVRLGGISTA